MTIPTVAAPLLLCATLLAGCATTTPPQTANADTPGYTGRTVLIGNNSTLAGDAEATYRQQKWGMSLKH